MTNRRKQDKIMLDFLALAQKCAPTVAPDTMAAIVNVESSYNPYAIGVVGGRLVRQPASRDEAVATAKQLVLDGWNFSVGLAQINRHHLSKYRMTYEQAFDACTNLHISSKILEDCYVRAVKRVSKPQAALRAAFSCYYSGNFFSGFKADVVNKQSYVQKVLARAGEMPKAIPVVPSIQRDTDLKLLSDKEVDSKDLDALKGPAIEPAAIPSDNAPVLLNPSNITNDGVVQRQPLTTRAAGDSCESVPKEIKAAGNDDLSSTKVDSPNSALVF